MRTLNVQRIQHTTGLAVDLAQKDLLLLDGEIIFESDTGKGKLGDGIHTWNELKYLNLGFETASDDEVDDMLDDVFGGDGDGGGNTQPGSDHGVASDDEIDDMLDDVFGDN
ncbi:MAG: hypothetical protein IJ667_07115 [Synergistaceae bacterium]|nr:hypothetical protein [Synergistaceae bacterium]